MTISTRHRALAGSLLAVCTVTMVAMGTAIALHSEVPVEAPRQLQPLHKPDSYPGIGAQGTTIDRSAVERVAPDATEDQPALAVAAYSA